MLTIYATLGALSIGTPSQPATMAGPVYVQITATQPTFIKGQPVVVNVRFSNPYKRETVVFLFDEFYHHVVGGNVLGFVDLPAGAELVPAFWRPGSRRYLHNEVKPGESLVIPIVLQSQVKGFGVGEVRLDYRYPARLYLVDRKTGVATETKRRWETGTLQFTIREATDEQLMETIRQTFKRLENSGETRNTVDFAALALIENDRAIPYFLQAITLMDVQNADQFFVAMERIAKSAAFTKKLGRSLPKLDEDGVRNLLNNLGYAKYRMADADLKTLNRPWKKETTKQAVQTYLQQLEAK